MTAGRASPRIVDFISHPDDFSGDPFDPDHPIQHVSKAGAHDRAYLRHWVPADRRDPLPGTIITYFLRDLLITLQGHPSILPTTAWNVDLTDSFRFYSIIILESTKNPLSNFINETISAMDPHEADESALIVLYGTARVLKLLHSHEIFHGNLAPEYCFINDQHWPVIGGLGWLTRSYGDGSIDEDLNNLYELCDLFVQEREDGSFTPPGLFRDWFDKYEEAGAADAVDYLDSLITADYPNAVLYRDSLNESVCEFHAQFLTKLGQLEPLAAIFNSGDLNFETMMAIAVLFFVISDAEPHHIRSLFRLAPITETIQDLLQPLLRYLTRDRHLPVHSPGAEPSHYPFEIVRQLPSVLGRRFFQAITRPSDFDRDDERHAHGSYGEVFVARRATHPGERVAIKQISAACRAGSTRRSRSASERVEPDGEIAGSFFREVLCLLLCEHPAVLPVIGWNLTPRDTRSPYFHVTSYVENCLVSNGLPLNLTGVDDTVKLKFAYGVACGMERFHQMDIFHRDLKLDNIFYDANGPRIADLGFAKVVRRGHDQFSQDRAAPEELDDRGQSEPDEQSGRRGTIAYTAPEVLRKAPRYDLSADVHSYGICLWELMTGALWGSTLSQRFPDTKTIRKAIKRGLRPRLDDEHLNAASRELLHSCFGADIKPRERPSFSDIVGRLEDPRKEYFAHADIAEFEKYKKLLDDARIEPIDENLKYLVEQLTNIIQDGKRHELPASSPFLDQILFCLGRLFGDETRQNDEVVLIARYQIVTKGYLDGSDFVRELDAICTFPSGRSNFVLGDFLIDPDQPVGENRWRTFLPISHQGDLFQALRGILGGICCEHPCVVTVHGWNIVDREGQWSVVIETDEAERLSIGDFERWTALDQSKFLLSAAIGVLDLHVRGVFHNNLQDAGAIQVHNGRARIFSFGLLDANASFEADTIACRELFGRATSSSSRLVREVNDEYGLHWCEPNFQGYIEEVLDEERHSSPGGEGPLQDLASDIANDAKPKYFPFDLFFHLVHSPELWRRREGPLDVAGGLAELTRGLDEEGKTRFEKEVNAEIAAHRFLRPGFPNTP